MAWSRKSAMFASLAVALYLLGLVLRNQQLVTVAVVLLSFLTWAAFRTSHADVSSSGRRLDDLQNDEANPLNYDQAYYVTGVLSNGNLMAQYQGSVSDNYSMLELDTTRNINTIGFDWKQYSGSYLMTPELSYYVADRNDQIVYKIIFTSFDGQSNGNLSFNLSEVEELMNVTENYTSNQLNIFPNPSKGLLFLDIDSSNPVNITVKNISGQTIRTEILDESNWLDLSDQIQGLYIIHVSGKDINTVKKVSILK